MGSNAWPKNVTMPEGISFGIELEQVMAVNINDFRQTYNPGPENSVLLATGVRNYLRAIYPEFRGEHPEITTVTVSTVTSLKDMSYSDFASTWYINPDVYTNDATDDPDQTRPTLVTIINEFSSNAEEDKPFCDPNEDIGVVEIVSRVFDAANDLVPLEAGSAGLQEARPLGNAMWELGHFIDTLREHFFTWEQVPSQKITGLHVHVGQGESGFTLQTLKNICAILVIFESSLDTIHPANRVSVRPKEGNVPDDNAFYLTADTELKSNRYWVCFKNPQVGQVDTAIFDLIMAQPNDAALSDLVMYATSGASKSYERSRKFNIKSENVALNTRTVEFRQHESTTSLHEIYMWIRLVVRIAERARDLSQQELKALIDNKPGDSELALVYLLQTVLDFQQYDPVVITYYLRKRGTYQPEHKYWAANPDERQDSDARGQKILEGLPVAPAPA